MSDVMLDKRRQLASAALGVFARYGYRRTSMDLVAQAAGISRPAVYQHFGNKEEVFREVSHLVTAQVAAAAQAASASAGPAADRLYATLAVKLDLVTGAVEAEFRAELLTEATDIVGDVVKEFEDRYRDIVESVLIDCADQLDLLGQALSTRNAATLLLDALTGIAQAREEPQILHARLRQLVELAVRGLTGSRQQG